MEKKDIRNIFQKCKRLFISIPQNSKEEFYQTIAKDNLTRVIFISIIYILFEINIMLTVRKKDIAYDPTLSIFITIFHILSIFISVLLTYKEKKVNGTIIQVFVFFYCAALVYWSVCVSLIQVSRTGSITMFILTLTGTSALFYRRSILTLITNFGFYSYFVLNLKLLIRSPLVARLRNIPFGNLPVGNFPPRPQPGNPPIGRIPPNHNPMGSTLQESALYISDAFLMTAICCALGIIVYRLRLKVFLEQKALKELALKDSMTNLFNHNTICNFLKEEIERSKLNLQPVSILMTDIDYFKKINDIYGHQVGDQVIVKIAKLLKEICGETNYVGRYGGEEFLVVLTNTNELDAVNFGERFRMEIEKMDFGVSTKVTMSGGVKTYKNESAEEMIKLADEALYQAKEQGRNCIINA